MSFTRKDAEKRLAEISSPSDVGYELESLMQDASEIGDPSLLQEIYEHASQRVESHYKANIVLWRCMANYFDKKAEAKLLFESTPLDDPEEFDDVYTEAAELLRACDCSEDEIENLQRDAEAMFDEDGAFQPDWRDRL